MLMSNTLRFAWRITASLDTPTSNSGISSLRIVMTLYIQQRGLSKTCHGYILMMYEHVCVKLHSYIVLHSVNIQVEIVLGGAAKLYA